MRVVDILDATGLPYAMFKFEYPPDEPYVTYNDEIIRRGGDLMCCINEHNVTLEVYTRDFFTEEPCIMIKRVLDRYAIFHTRYSTNYLEDEHLYMTVFEFSFIEKEKIKQNSRYECNLPYDSGFKTPHV